MLALLERIVGRKKQREQDRDQAFRGLVKRIVAGQDIDPDAAAEILEATGKSDADLQQAVDFVKERQALKTQLAAFTGIKARIAEIEKTIAAEAAKLKEAKQRYHKVVDPINEEWKRLHKTKPTKDEIRRKLNASCPDQTLRDEYDAIGKRIVALEARRQRVAEVQLRLQVSIEQPKRFGGDGDELKRDRPQLEAQLGDVVAEIAALDRELGELKDRQEKIWEAMVAA